MFCAIAPSLDPVWQTRSWVKPLRCYMLSQFHGSTKNVYYMDLTDLGNFAGKCREPQRNSFVTSQLRRNFLG